MILGLLIIGGLAMISVFYIHFALAIILACGYVSGLVYLTIKSKRLLNENLIKIHFNLSLVLKNEN